MAGAIALVHSQVQEGGEAVSDTPRTDAECGDYNLRGYWKTHINGSCVQIVFSRQLERELNAANAEIEEKRKDVVWLATEKAKLENYVMRLEEAGDKIVEAGWSVQDWSGMCVVWAKAKESKP